MLIRIFLVAASCSALLPQIVAAQTFYGDVNFGTAPTEIDLPIPVSDDDFNLQIVKARIGFAAAKHLSVEAEFMVGTDDQVSSLYGIIDGGFTRTGVFDFGLGQGASVFARGNWPVGNRAEVFARLGYASLEFDFDAGGENARRLREVEAGIAYGVGAAYALTDRFYFRGDITRYNSEYFDSETVTVGAGVKF